MTNEPKPLILVCDDEEELREMVGEYLERRGFSVVQCTDAPSLRTAMDQHGGRIAAIILDINMPGEDGLSALRALRVEHDTPVIMLTATAEVVDRILGLEMGADDYLGKPVDLRELEARLKTVLRRRAPPPQAAGAEAATSRISFGPCTLDLEAALLFDASGAEIPITSMEFSLLKVFARNRGRVLNRDQLLEQAHDRDWDPFDRSIDIRISRLRRKIEPNPSRPEVIRTVRGLGYVFGERV